MSRSLRSPFLAPTACVAVLSIAPVAAQPPGETPQKPAGEQRIEILERRHDRARSWSLFRACDANADDRLDIFEFKVAFGIVDKAAKYFSRLDLSRNGHLNWPEFDAHFRAEVERASEFRLFPPLAPRPFEDPAAPKLEIDPGMLLIRGHDRNGDRRLQPFEFAGFLASSKLPSELQNQFGALDQNGNGALEPDEFSPVARQVPGIMERVRNTPDPRSSLPPDDRAADRDLNGVLDQQELRAGLQAIHPRLGSLANVVLQRANASLDRPQRLGGSELVRARRSAREWLAERARELAQSDR